MKHLLTLTLMLGTLFPGVYSEETGWNYKQTTLQSFYMFDSTELTIDGEGIQSEDVVGVFTADGVCYGWTHAEADGNGFITVPTVGDDGSDYSGNYAGNGDVPIFRVFDASSGDDSTPTTQNGVMSLDLSGAGWSDGSDGGFSNNAIYISAGPAVAAIPSISLILVLLSFKALLIIKSIFSTCALAAISGTTPPNSLCSST